MTVGLNNVSIDSILNNHFGGQYRVFESNENSHTAIRDNSHVQDLSDVPVYLLKGAEPLINPKPTVALPKGIYGAMCNGGPKTGTDPDLTYMASFMDVSRGRPDRRQDGHYRINSFTKYEGSDPSTESRGDTLAATFYSDTSGLPGSLGFNTFIPITDNWELYNATGGAATAHLVFRTGRLQTLKNEHCLFLIRAYQTDYLRGASVDCCLEEFTGSLQNYDEQISFSLSKAKAVDYKSLIIAQAVWLPNNNDSSITGLILYRSVVRAG